MMSELRGVSSNDVAHLEHARALARRGWGRVHPNPLVGCVIVKDDHVVGEGYHELFGGPHAEIIALEEAKDRAEGATAYVTLEPCRHHGKTPPCARALVEAGISRVVFGARDPGAKSGGGAGLLRDGDVDVHGPTWSDQVGRAEHPAFFHAATHDTPYVAVKLAVSLDSSIAARPGERTQITGPEAGCEVHRLRTGFAAVMIGAGTLRIDNPRLTARTKAVDQSGVRRILLVPDASISSDAAIFEEADESPVHVFVRRGTSEVALERLEKAGAEINPVKTSPAGLDLDDVLRVCSDLGLHSILCEGGAKLANALLQERLVNRLYLFVAPTTLGSDGVPAFMENARDLIWSDFEPAFPPELHGRDTLIVLDRQEG